jgi:hypothetical protein
VRRFILVASAGILVASVAFAIWGVHGFWVGCQGPEDPFSTKHWLQFPCDPIGYNNHMPTRVAIVVAGGGLAFGLLFLARRLRRQTSSN